jgi:hypothetical protein
MAAASGKGLERCFNTGVDRAISGQLLTPLSESLGCTLISAEKPPVTLESLPVIAWRWPRPMVLH